MPPVNSRTIIRSSPPTSSRLRLEASARASKTTAGRRLAKRSISLRSRRMPRSGRSSNGNVSSHLGPPTAPKRTASLAIASARVWSVSGTPDSSRAAPPTKPSVISKLAIRCRSQYSITRKVWRMISGPMPSPASTSTLRLDTRVWATRLSPWADHAELPRPRQPRLLLIGGDFHILLLRQADVVEAVQQTMLAESINLEMHLVAVRPRDRLSREVDRHHGIGALAGILHQLIDDLFGQGNRQDAVLEAIIIEDVGKARRDDAADAEIEKRPGRVLAARPAAKIVRSDQDLGVAIRRLVEHEIRVLRPIRAKADLLEQPFRKAGPFDCLQIYRRKDLVGIEIDDRQRSRDAAQLREFFHSSVPSLAPWLG